MSTLYYETNYLMHHGIKGQKWGIRRFQNPDGSLTAAGKNRYSTLERKSHKWLLKEAQAMGMAEAAVKKGYSEIAADSVRKQLKAATKRLNIDEKNEVQAKYDIMAGRKEQKRLQKNIEKADMKGNQKRVEKLKAKKASIDAKVELATDTVNRLENRGKNIILRYQGLGYTVVGKPTTYRVKRSITKGQAVASALSTVALTALMVPTAGMAVAVTPRAYTYMPGTKFKIKANL